MTIKRQWIAFMTILRKEVVRFLRIWKQTLLPPVINQFLYFIIFGAFIGSQIRDIDGISYMAFIVPGLVMMGVINSSFMNVVSSFFGAKFQNNIEELLVSPTSVPLIIAGYVMGGALRGLIVGVLVFFVSIAFTSPVIFNGGLILLFSFLTAILFALGGLLNGIFAQSFDDIGLFTTFILTPLTYFGGVFYSIHDLPEFWQIVSRFNPILYMVNGFRYGFYGVTDVNVWISVSILCGFVLLLGTLNYVLIKRGIGLRS
jgi:ABC-2 type transport system permease protein